MCLKKDEPVDHLLFLLSLGLFPVAFVSFLDCDGSGSTF